MYNSMKGNPSWYSPEEATSQNINYMVCSAFPKNVYYELLGIKIPPYTDSLKKYAHDNIGKPEVIAYGEKGVNTEGKKCLKMKFYDSTAENNFIEIDVMTLDQIKPYLQIRRCSYI